jgi:hypothetical protein
MSVGTLALRGLATVATCAITAVLLPSPAQATIHPIVQSIGCAAVAAFENAPIADPPGQTPDEFSGEIMSVEGSLVIISFPEPLELSQSDFRALIATGFIDDIRVNSDGLVTAVVVDVTSIPKAVSGEGFANCANG